MLAMFVGKFVRFEKSRFVIIQNAVRPLLAYLTFPARIINHVNRRSLFCIHKVSISKQKLFIIKKDFCFQIKYTNLKVIDNRKNILLVSF